MRFNSRDDRHVSWKRPCQRVSCEVSGGVITLEGQMTRSIFGLGARCAILVLALGVLVMALPAAAGAKPGGKSPQAQKAGPKVTVMTRNVYLGADLGPALSATTLEGAVDGGGVIWNEVEATNFPERAVPLAKEIEESNADLV